MWRPPYRELDTAIQRNPGIIIKMSNVCALARRMIKLATIYTPWPFDNIYHT